ncbi:hypothetical protein D3C73_1621680 [compost metagenome]
MTGKFFAILIEAVCDVYSLVIWCENDFDLASAPFFLLKRGLGRRGRYVVIQCHIIAL